ncbi:MAG: DUF4382 domain-containing protein [Bacteroidota bacterium]
MKTMIRTGIAGILVLAIAFYSCKKDFSVMHDGSFHDLNKSFIASIYLTDHQTPVLDSIFIDIQKLEIKLEDDSLPADGCVSLAIHPGVYTILQLRNGLDTLFGTGTLPSGHVKKVRLTLGNQNSVMIGGQSFELNIHDNEFQVEADLDDSNFDITNAGQLLFWIDFDAAKSIRVDNSGHGNNNGYKLEPHINIFTKSKSGRIEGKVLPKDAQPLVMAINGTDTTMAIPEDDDGEFKISGLKEGSYDVVIDGNNGYSDTTISNVVVTKNEDTHLGIITLHK